MHSFTSGLMHCIFSTKHLEPLLSPKVRERLWPYFGGIARKHDMKALSAGGVSDHVHLLLSTPSTLCIAKALQLIKGNSSKWLHETFPKLRGLSWQEGYGAFSLSITGMEATVRYIRTQEEHHRQRGFVDELKIMLKKAAPCLRRRCSGEEFDSVVPEGLGNSNLSTQR